MPKQAWDVSDQGGGLYAVRGHVTAEDWAESVRLFDHADTPPDVLFIEHWWWRYVPGDGGGDYQHASPGSHGAFRVTVGEVA